MPRLFQATAGSGGCLAQGNSSQKNRFEHPSAKQLATYCQKAAGHDRADCAPAWVRCGCR